MKIGENTLLMHKLDPGLSIFKKSPVCHFFETAFYEILQAQSHIFQQQ